MHWGEPQGPQTGTRPPGRPPLGGSPRERAAHGCGHAGAARRSRSPRAALHRQRARRGWVGGGGLGGRQRLGGHYCSWLGGWTAANAPLPSNHNDVKASWLQGVEVPAAAEVKVCQRTSKGVDVHALGAGPPQQQLRRHLQGGVGLEQPQFGNPPRGRGNRRTVAGLACLEAAVSVPAVHAVHEACPQPALQRGPSTRPSHPARSHSQTTPLPRCGRSGASWTASA